MMSIAIPIVKSCAIKYPQAWEAQGLLTVESVTSVKIKIAHPSDVYAFWCEILDGQVKFGVQRKGDTPSTSISLLLTNSNSDGVSVTGECPIELCWPAEVFK
jgi:hypothetical protein